MTILIVAAAQALIFIIAWRRELRRVRENADIGRTIALAEMRHKSYREGHLCGFTKGIFEGAYHTLEALGLDPTKDGWPEKVAASVKRSPN